MFAGPRERQSSGHSLPVKLNAHGCSSTVWYRVWTRLDEFSLGMWIPEDSTVMLDVFESLWEGRSMVRKALLRLGLVII